MNFYELRLLKADWDPHVAMGANECRPLSDQDVDNIVAYIRQWQREPSLDVHNLVFEGAAPRGRVPTTSTVLIVMGSQEKDYSDKPEQSWFHLTASDG